MNGTGKAWWASKTTWGSIIAFLAGIATLAGVKLDATLQDQLAELIVGLANIVGGAVAFYGRIKANTTINPTLTGAAPRA